MWAMVINKERLWSNTNFGFIPLSEAEFIAGIKNSPVGIAETDMKKINKIHQICDYQNRRSNQSYYEYIKIKERKCFTNKEPSGRYL